MVATVKQVGSRRCKKPISSTRNLRGKLAGTRGVSMFRTPTRPSHRPRPSPSTFVYARRLVPRRTITARFIASTATVRRASPMRRARALCPPIRPCPKSNGTSRSTGDRTICPESPQIAKAQFARVPQRAVSAMHQTAPRTARQRHRHPCHQRSHQRARELASGRLPHPRAIRARQAQCRPVRQHQQPVAARQRRKLPHAVHIHHTPTVNAHKLPRVQRRLNR